MLSNPWKFIGAVGAGYLSASGLSLRDCLRVPQLELLGESSFEKLALRAYVSYKIILR